MAKNLYGVTFTRGDGSKQVCTVIEYTTDRPRAATKQECITFMSNMRKEYPDTEYQLFKFKFKEEYDI